VQLEGEVVSDDLLTTAFVPCVIALSDPKRVEMVLRDCATVWVQCVGAQDVDLGYDMETGDLVSIRVYGDVLKRKS
jgi:hypothetical protein